MNQPKNVRVPLVPKLIMTAFVLGAVLWGVWMLKFVNKTRQDKLDRQNADPIYVPMATNANANGSSGAK